MSGWRSCCARARCGSTASAPKAADRVATGQTVRLPPQVVHAKMSARRKPQPKPGTRWRRRTWAAWPTASSTWTSRSSCSNKPPGLATQGGSGLTRHVDGMLDSLQYEKPTRPKLVHRLDRDTSGVLLVARTAPAASGLSQSLALRDTSKVYWALTRGVPKQKHGVDQGRAGQGRRPRPARPRRTHDRRRDDDDAKYALTEYAVMAHRGRRSSPGSRRGRSPAAPTRSACIWPAWARPSSAISNMAARMRAARARSPTSCICMPARIDIGRPDGGRLQATAPLPPHMLKSWKLLGFDPDDKSDPFPVKKKKKMKRFYKDVSFASGGRRLCRAAGWPAGARRQLATIC